MMRKFFSAGIALLGMMAGVVHATTDFDPIDNSGKFNPYTTYNYLVPPQVLPTFDCTNFVILGSGQFIVNYANFSVNTEYYEPKNTINFTNSGQMMANSGLRFDTLTTNLLTPHVPAANFYNSGFIGANSTNDTGANLLLYSTYGQVQVNASNVVNSGTLDVGTYGNIVVNGQHLNLDDGTMTVESSVATTSGLNYSLANFQGFGAFGLDTNADWNPYFALGANAAYTSFPYFFQITNSQAYFDSPRVNPSNASNVIYRVVFVQNANPNLPYKVFYDNPSTSFGNGSGYVEWDGSYVDPGTGNTVSSYLYLNVDYVLAVSTNEYINTLTGLPGAFTLVQSSQPIPLGNPVSAGYLNIFPNQYQTNRYTYMSGSLGAITEPTNATPINPNGSLTNLYSRIQITSSGDLSMAGATISGPNYVSVTCTNQFNGSAGATISAPYADLNLGVTNGFLTVSNLLMANIPQWNGQIQAWATRFFVPNASGGSNDFRVLVVYDNFQPVTPPWVRGMYLHATNSLVISDVLNVYGSYFADAQNLTLTTNLYGYGASSPDGEINFDSGTAFTTAQMPNLVWFTNNGAMRCLNSVTFGNNYSNFSWLATNSVTNITRTATNIVNTVTTNRLPSGWMAAVINNSYMTNTATIANTLNFTNAGGLYTGSLYLQAMQASLLNGVTFAGGDVNVTASNLLVSGESVTAGHAIYLTASSMLSDGEQNLVANGLTNGNIWVVGTNSLGGVADSGINAPLNPFNGDLLGTTITNYAPAGKKIYNVWAGADYGPSLAGFTNNLAVGHLVLDAASGGNYVFNGTNTSGGRSAMYVDCLELRDSATSRQTVNQTLTYNLANLAFATNFTLYYAQALYENTNTGALLSLAEKLNGVNGGHLVWVPQYAGYFSYTNLVYPNGTTNAVNAALAQSGTIDSSGYLVNGIQQYGNSSYANPIFVSSEVNLNVVLTNRARLLTWNIPATATNYTVQYLTNLNVGSWMTLTNYVWSTNSIPLSFTNAAYLDTNRIVNQRFYRVVVQPWLTWPKF